MMPNIDPKALKSMMAKMGIKSSEINAIRVVIQSADSDIIVDNPQVTRIEAQGTVSFQITGEIHELKKDTKLEVTNDDIKFVSEKSGVSDKDKVLNAINESNGDLAEAILKLSG
jgi:nascent polypeptide-associated complex subunit alpha